MPATQSATKTVARNAQAEAQTTERKLGVAMDYGSANGIKAIGTTKDGRTIVTALLWNSGKTPDGNYAQLPPTRIIVVGEPAEELLSYVDRKFVEVQAEGYWKPGDEELDAYVKYTFNKGKLRCSQRMLHTRKLEVLKLGEVKELPSVSDSVPVDELAPAANQEEIQF